MVKIVACINSTSGNIKGISKIFPITICSRHILLWARKFIPNITSKDIILYELDESEK